MGKPGGVKKLPKINLGDIYGFRVINFFSLLLLINVSSSGFELLFKLIIVLPLLSIESVLVTTRQESFVIMLTLQISLLTIEQQPLNIIKIDRKVIYFNLPPTIAHNVSPLPRATSNLKPQYSQPFESEDSNEIKQPAGLWSGLLGENLFISPLIYFLFTFSRAFYIFTEIVEKR